MQFTDCVSNGGRGSLLYDDHRLEVTLHSASFTTTSPVTELVLLVTMRKKRGQLLLVTLITGQQSGAAPCRSGDGFNFSFSPLFKSTVRAVQVRIRSRGVLASVAPCLPLNAVCSRQPAGRSEGSKPAVARLLQRHCEGEEDERSHSDGERRRVHVSQSYMVDATLSCTVVQHLLSRRFSLREGHYCSIHI